MSIVPPIVSLFSMCKPESQTYCLMENKCSIEPHVKCNLTRSQTLGAFRFSTISYRNRQFDWSPWWNMTLWFTWDWGWSPFHILLLIIWWFKRHTFQCPSILMSSSGWMMTEWNLSCVSRTFCVADFICGAGDRQQSSLFAVLWKKLCSSLTQVSMLQQYFLCFFGGIK